jgi:hypothetical protein
MTQDVLVTLNTLLQAIFVFPVKLRANILPAGGRQNVAIVVDDRGGKGVDFIQPILQVLKMRHVDQILQFVVHGEGWIMDSANEDID